jgi:large subunit ribosomal protein L29
MKAKELREKTPAELNALVLEKRREQFNARMQRGSGAEVRPEVLRTARRDIARIKTILTEKTRSA